MICFVLLNMFVFPVFSEPLRRAAYVPCDVCGRTTIVQSDPTQVVVRLEYRFIWTQYYRA